MHDDDLQEFLSRIGIWSDLAAGNLRCWSCDEVVSIENLSAVFPDGSNVAVVCDQRACYEKLVAKKE